jgi:hypothetical protein
VIAIAGPGDSLRRSPAGAGHRARRPSHSGPSRDGIGGRGRGLAEIVRTSVRVAVTEKLTTLALTEETLRLGQDLRGPAPEHLRALTDRDLVTLLAAVDPSFDSTQGSGATDWASLRQRMHFVADLFRTRQEVASLLGPPFSPEQTIAIKANRRPAGSL